MPSPASSETSVVRVGRKIVIGGTVTLTVSPCAPWVVTLNGHVVETYEDSLSATSLANRLASALGQVKDISWFTEPLAR